jgi:single-stranded-DNA-specific exonuclease
MSGIKNLKKASKRIKEAISNKEDIILFSDADLDGVTSLIILEETIKNLGGKISIRYLFNRGKEGNGLTEIALDFLKKYSPGLLILSDCGVGNFKEVKSAQKLGFKVIIIDHHLVLGKIPKAEIVIDSKQKADNYPFKFLAACGVCFKLSQELLKAQKSLSLEQSLLELATIGTIDDKVPLKEDNKFLVENGLAHLPFTSRPGLKVFFKIFNQGKYSVNEIVQKIISILQFTEMKNHLNETYKLLTSANDKKVEKLVQKLIEKSLSRLGLVKECAQRIEEKIFPDSIFIFEGGKEVPISFTGSIASKILAKLQKPIFIFAVKNDMIRGSVRTPKEINSVDVLKHCSSYLQDYGGHAPASGFCLKKNNLEKFKTCLEEYFSNL